jgi:hypothetical protein
MEEPPPPFGFSNVTKTLQIYAKIYIPTKFSLNTDLIRTYFYIILAFNFKK